MTTTTCKTAKQTAKELKKIASNYAGVYESNLIECDMDTYIKYRILEYAEFMKDKAVGKFSYTETFYIRHHGIESSKADLEQFSDKAVAIVTVKYDKSQNLYTIIKQNI
jgi:hypothetical protein